MSIVEESGSADGEFELPINIFCQELSSLEAITKYLKENVNLSFSEIADALNRDDRTIWGTYQRSLRKFPEQLIPLQGCLTVPSTLFRNRSFGVLEALTFYLKDRLGMRYCQIAGLLSRDDRTVWTAFMRARRKLNGQ